MTLDAAVANSAPSSSEKRQPSEHAETANLFMDNLACRLANPIQLTTDGHHVYPDAVVAAFADDVDYAMLVKLYGEDPAPGPERKYSPGECVGARKEPKIGDPDPRHVSTSHVERQNLNMWMGMRRFTRLTNAFSKKIDNHIHALSLYFVFYNFVRTHKAHKLSPAMADGRWRQRSALEHERYRRAD